VSERLRGWVEGVFGGWGHLSRRVHGNRAECTFRTKLTNVTNQHGRVEEERGRGSSAGSSRNSPRPKIQRRNQRSYCPTLLHGPRRSRPYPRRDGRGGGGEYGRNQWLRYRLRVTSAAPRARRKSSAASSGPTAPRHSTTRGGPGAARLESAKQAPGHAPSPGRMLARSRAAARPEGCVEGGRSRRTRSEACPSGTNWEEGVGNFMREMPV